MRRSKFLLERHHSLCAPIPTVLHHHVSPGFYLLLLLFFLDAAGTDNADHPNDDCGPGGLTAVSGEVSKCRRDGLLHARHVLLRADTLA